MPKWVVWTPKPIEPSANAGVRLDGSIDRSVDTWPERVAARRKAELPVIDAEFEAEKAARERRAVRIVRCPGCSKSVYVGKPCWYCSMGTDRELPPLTITHTTKRRDDAKRAARSRAARNR